MTDEAGHPDAERHRLRYEVAQRSTEQQMASVDAAQGRASLLIAVLAITATELGTRAADKPGNPFPFMQAVAWLSLGICAGALVVAMWPRGYRGPIKAEALPNKPAVELVQDLVVSLVEVRDRNAPAVRRIWISLKLAIVAMIVNATAWGTILLWR